MSGLEALLAGKTLVKRYEIQEVIGRGGFAAVYRANDLRLGRPVAVKVITAAAPDSETRDRLHARFEREARSAASLPHHPNVVTVHDFGTDPQTGIDFLVMELLRGETLAQYLARDARPPLARSLQILHEAAEGLAMGHRSGLVHRDVKPGNLFLAEPHADEPFRVVVLDFGIARIVDDDTHDITRTAMGENPLSPAYASPEQLRGERTLTPASDVFGLGVVAYQLLAGEKPFAADPGQRARGRGAVKPLREMNPQVPPALVAVVERAMAERPDDRFADAGVFADALEAAAGPDDRTMVFAPAPDDDATLLVPAATLAGAAAASRAADRTAAAPPPRPAAPPPPPPPAGREPAPAPARKRSPVGALLVVLLLLAGGAAAAVWAFGGGGSGDADEGVATVPGDSATETTDEPAAERIDGTILPSPAETPPSGGDPGGDDAGIVGDDDGSPVVPGGTASPPGSGETPPPPTPEPEGQPAITPPPPAPGGQPPVPVTPTPPPAQPQPTPPITRPTPPVQPPRQQPVPRPAPAPAPPPAPPPPPPAPAPPPVLGRPAEPRPATPASNPNAPRDTIVLPTRQPSTPGPASSGTTP